MKEKDSPGCSRARVRSELKARSPKGPLPVNARGRRPGSGRGEAHLKGIGPSAPTQESSQAVPLMSTLPLLAFQGQALATPGPERRTVRVLGMPPVYRARYQVCSRHHLRRCPPGKRRLPAFSIVLHVQALEVVHRD